MFVTAVGYDVNSTFHCPLCDVPIFDTRKVSETGRASAKNMKPVYSWDTFCVVSPAVFMYENIMNTIIYVSTTYLLKQRLHVLTHH